VGKKSPPDRVSPRGPKREAIGPARRGEETKQSCREQCPVAIEIGARAAGLLHDQATHMWLRTPPSPPPSPTKPSHLSTLFLLVCHFQAAPSAKSTACISVSRAGSSSAETIRSEEEIQSRHLMQLVALAAGKTCGILHRVFFHPNSNMCRELFHFKIKGDQAHA